jgi:DNA-dependent metalloprotease WSS1
VEAEKAIRDGEVQLAIDLPPVDINSHIIDIDSSDDDHQVGPSNGGVPSTIKPNGNAKSSVPRSISPDLIILSDEEDRNPAAKRQRTTIRQPSTSVSAPPTVSSTSTSSRQPHAESETISEIGVWSCSTCTYLNAPLSLQCEICLAQKSVSMGDEGHEKGWACLFCGEKGMDDIFWTCRSCGWVKTKS